MDDGGGDFSTSTPAGLIQSNEAFWPVGGLDPLCCKKGIYWLLFWQSRKHLKLKLKITARERFVDKKLKKP